jgi:Tol biopolymer transport system component
VQPSVSPDGRVIAFARHSSLSEADVYTLDVRNGSVARVTRDAHAIRGIAWAGNAYLVWSSDRAGRVSSLWTTSIHGGHPVLLSGAEGTSKYPSMRGSRLVYQFGTRDVNNWCSDRPAPVAASTAAEENPSLSPDGLRLAFVSRRSGIPEVWMSRSDGAIPEQLTHLAGGYTDSPRWSPDASHLAFTSVQNGNRDVLLLRLADRAVWNLTRHPSDEGRPSWSPDGRTLYFRSDRSGTPQLWRQPIDGGPATMITTHGGVADSNNPSTAPMTSTPPPHRAVLAGTGNRQPSRTPRAKGPIL